MNVFGWKRHPARPDLFAYAESLVDKRTISAKMAGHVAACPACQAEVRSIRASLEFVGEAPALEPSTDLTSRILLAAQQERRAQQRCHARRSAAVSLAKGVAYAAGVLLVGAVCFSAALNHGVAPLAAPTVMAQQPAAAPAPSPEAIRKAAAEIPTLTAAVSAPSKKPPSAWELERRRAVHALDDDLEAARAALERNPGSPRANHLVDLNLQRQAQTLRALYAERSL